MIQMQAHPIGVADFHGFANRICEGTERIRVFLMELHMQANQPW